MNAVDRLFRRLRVRSETSRSWRRGDPSHGIPYNNISRNAKVSRHVWRADIAASPNVVNLSPTGKPLNTEVQCCAHKANAMRLTIDYWYNLFKGRVK